MSEYAPQLFGKPSDRMVGAFLGWTSCISDWATFARLALPIGDCRNGIEHNVLANIMEASTRFAIGDVLDARLLAPDAFGAAALDACNAAALTLAKRVPDLLEAYSQAEGAAPCEAFCRNLLRHYA